MSPNALNTLKTIIILFLFILFLLLCPKLTNAQELPETTIPWMYFYEDGSFEFIYRYHTLNFDDNGVLHYIEVDDIYYDKIAGDSWNAYNDEGHYLVIHGEYDNMVEFQNAYRNYLTGK